MPSPTVVIFNGRKLPDILPSVSISGIHNDCFRTQIVAANSEAGYYNYER